MRNRIRVALAIVSVALAGCEVEPLQPLGGAGGGGGEAGQGGSGAAGSGGVGGVGGVAGQGGTGGTGGGTAGTGGSEDPDCIPEERTDEFRKPPPPQIDVLWVIDNSKAMAPFVERLADHLAGALKALAERRIDYRLAVTTTGLEESPDCDGPVRGGEDGRFVPADGSNPRILDNKTPDRAEVWRESVAVGACHHSSHPLDAAWRALSEPLADAEKDPRHDTEWMDGNAGFLRPDAPLTIVFVTANDVVAGAERLPIEYLDLYQSIKGRRRPMTVSAITGPKALELSAGCPAAAAGDRLIALTENSNGLALDICSLSEDGWEWVDLVPRFSSPTRYFLSSLPIDKNRDGIVDEADLLLRIDATVLPRFASDGRRAWTYDPRTNVIDFAPLFIPRPEAVVRVSYLTCPPG